MCAGGPSRLLGGPCSPSPSPSSAAPRSTGSLSSGSPPGVPSRQLSSQPAGASCMAMSPSRSRARHRRPHHSASAAPPPSPASSTTMALPAVADVSAIVGSGCTRGGLAGGASSGGGGGGGGGERAASARRRHRERDCGNALWALLKRPNGCTEHAGGCTFAATVAAAAARKRGVHVRLRASETRRSTHRAAHALKRGEAPSPARRQRRRVLSRQATRALSRIAAPARSLAPAGGAVQRPARIP